MSLTDLLGHDRWVRQLFERSPDPAWIIDGNRFVECNDAAVRTLGYGTRDEFLNVHPSRLSPPRQPCGEDSFTKAERMMALALANGLHRFEWVHTRADGTPFDAEVTLSAITLEGHPLIYCAWRDISERKAVEVALRRAQESAEAANQAKSRFLATMSHEIRTPLNGVLGMAQLLLLPDLEGDERREYAQTILTSGQTLLALLNDILDLSRVEAGRMGLVPVRLSLRHLLADTASLFSHLAQGKGLELTARWTGAEDAVYLADGTRLRQMVDNLVGNAIKFTARGFVRVEATELERSAEAATLEFSVSDSGIGIPARQQAQLFEPFIQADSSTTREYGGTGLGLSIVRSLARLMGGSAGVESEAGRGSRFWFRVQVGLAGPETPREDAPAAEARAAPRPDMAHPLVLVAEDNVINRRVLEALLGKWGARVHLAQHGQEAVEAVRGGLSPALVLMDVQMPVMDGVMAATFIRDWERTTGRPRLPIVALTAGAFDEDRQRCLAAGMDDFLTKPLNAGALARVLERWMARAPALGA